LERAGNGAATQKKAWEKKHGNGHRKGERHEEKKKFWTKKSFPSFGRRGKLEIFVIGGGERKEENDGKKLTAKDAPRNDDWTVSLPATEENSRENEGVMKKSLPSMQR